MNQEKAIKAGQIAAQALDYGCSLIKEGAVVKDILDQVETKITTLGGKPAFCAQISLNETAAHDCANLTDETVLSDQVVKLDVGVHVDGWIGDNARTTDLSGKYTDLLKANKEALDAAIATVAPGTTLGAVGKAVQEVITSYGFSPIKNLCGHGLGHYNIHTKPSIPNYDNKSTTVLKEDMHIAIEPFASTGSGMVQESGNATIFTLTKTPGVRDPITRKVLERIKSYEGLPFAARWLEREFSVAKTQFALRTLSRSGALLHHPPLVDTGKGVVSQMEHSMIVKDKPIVTTKL